MLKNMSFYSFTHRQVVILIILTLATGPSYLVIGYFHSSILPETLWLLSMVTASMWGYKLYKEYLNKNLSIAQKENWLRRSQYFFYTFFSLWTIMFLLYTSREEIVLHYIAIGTQIGSSVVAATLLASHKRLVIVTVISLMLPLAIYFFVLGELFGYILSFFTVVLSFVLLYAARNTYEYLVKSRYQAYHDYLTSLANRRYFIEHLEDSIKNENGFSYILLIDLDHFKMINDTLGHDVGDALLIEVAKRMRELSHKYNNSVSRLGGDEFAVISTAYEDKEKCLEDSLQFAEVLLRSIKERYYIGIHDLYMSASIGVSIIGNTSVNAQTFIKEADIAMYEVKLNGRDGIVLFNEELAHRVEEKLEIERLLYFSIENSEISLRFQPQINPYSGKISCEVLTRWHNEKLGSISPDLFIPMSEQNGFIIELGHYILEESIKTFKNWKDRGVKVGCISINISMRQMFHNSFVRDVKILLDKYLPPELHSKIIFEITETSEAEDMYKLIEVMQALKDLGIKFSMDDFGTGYSSLSYLSKIPIDELKIDKSFICDLSPANSTIITTILNVAKNLNLQTVAEGVESSNEKEFLIENGCDILQGYYYSKPLSKADFEEFLSTNGI